MLYKNELNEKKRKVVLVIDDEKGILEEMQAWLGDHGYHVVTATNGADGLQKLNEVTPNLIVLDVIMPQMDGFEVLLRLKNDLKTSSIPVIMLTAREDTSSILKALEMKVADYVIKPFNTEELLKSIRIFER